MNNNDYDELRNLADHLEKETGMDLSDAKPAITIEDDPSKKVYLILIISNGDDIEDHELNTYEYRDWIISVGRQETYDKLKDYIETNGINPAMSFILSGSTSPENAITVYRFMKTCYESGKVVDNSDFDIDDGYEPILPEDDVKITEV